MTTAARFNLLKELIEELDYDLYKSMFVKACIEDPEETKEQVSHLLDIIKSYDA